MATHDYVLANQSGSSFRTDLNNALAAVVSLNSNSSEPSTTYAFMLWVDTTNNLIKLRNSANNAWITLFTSTGGVDVDAASNFNEDVTFTGASSNAVWDKSDNALEFADNAKATFGGGVDLSVFHNATNSEIKNITGILFLESDGTTITDKEGSDVMAKFIHDASCELYEDNALRLETTSDGINVTCVDDAVLYITTTGTDAHDDARLEFVTQESTFKIQNDRSLGTDGALTVKAESEDCVYMYKDGAVSLFFNHSLKFETYTSGCKVTGYLHAYEDESDSDHGISATKHVIQQSTGSQAACVIEHTANTNPYGLYIDFSDGSPDNSTHWFLSCDDSSANRLKILSSGDITTSDGGTVNSDETLKENIVDATSKLEDIKKLKVRNFNWKSSYHPEESKRKHIGFIAQEVEQVFPSLVQEYDIAPGSTKDDHTPVMKKGIKQAWNPIIVKAMQELIAKVETLETKVAALEG